MPTSAANAAVPAPAASTTASNAVRPAAHPDTARAPVEPASTCRVHDGVPREPTSSARTASTSTTPPAGSTSTGPATGPTTGRPRPSRGVPQLVGHAHRRHRQGPLGRVPAGDHAPDRVDDPRAPPGEARARRVGQPHQVGVDVGEPEDPRRPRRPLPHHGAERSKHTTSTPSRTRHAAVANPTTPAPTTATRTRARLVSARWARFHAHGRPHRAAVPGRARRQPAAPARAGAGPSRLRAPAASTPTACARSRTTRSATSSPCRRTSACARRPTASSAAPRGTWTSSTSSAASSAPTRNSWCSSATTRAPASSSPPGWPSASRCTSTSRSSPTTSGSWPSRCARRCRR